MKKVVVTTLFVIVIGALFAGCGESNTASTAQESTEIRLHDEFIEEGSSAEETEESNENVEVTYPLYSTRSDNGIVSSDMALISYSLLDKAISNKNEDAWAVTYGYFEMSEFNTIVKECERYADYFGLKLSALMNDDDTFYITFRKDYCVKRGDTLTKIASKYGISVEDIINLNSDVISNPDELEAGTLLRLY